jgi:hypothetical protein
MNLVPNTLRRILARAQRVIIIMNVHTRQGSKQGLGAIFGAFSSQTGVFCPTAPISTLLHPKTFLLPPLTQPTPVPDS